MSKWTEVRARTPLVSVRNIDVTFGNGRNAFKAVDNVSFDIYRGETFGLVGESGSGKTTIGRAIIRINKVSAGDILYEGKRISGKIDRECDREVIRNIQMIFQDPYSSLNSRMSVEELIAAPLLVNDICPRSEVSARVAQLMDTVGLARRMAASYPHELDGGRRQRIGVARALAVEPEFIVCDEPVSALDVSIQAQILNLLMDIQEERHIAYMFITHDLSVVKHISNRIGVMYLGKMMEIAPKGSLYNDPLSPYTQALLSAIPIPELGVQKERIPIKGEITSPINMPDECRFFKRCQYACDKCKAVPPLVEVTPGHFVACFRQDELN